MSEKTIPVVEIFGPTLQGEGAMAGLRTMFIRTGYCDGAGDRWCAWCDSMFAVDPKNKKDWTWMTPDEIITQLELLGPHCKVVTISGGNPLVHDLGDLVNHLDAFPYYVNVETQGTIYRPWLHNVDQVTVSPKPPSAGECNIDRLEEFMENLRTHGRGLPTLCLKIVVDPFSMDDYSFAKGIVYRYKDWWGTKYLSVLTDPNDTSTSILNKYRLLAERVMRDHTMLDVAVLPQLHVLLWGHRQGV